jgi:hypothetical protein
MKRVEVRDPGLGVGDSAVVWLWVELGSGGTILSL